MCFEFLPICIIKWLCLLYAGLRFLFSAKINKSDKKNNSKYNKWDMNIKYNIRHSVSKASKRVPSGIVYTCQVILVIRATKDCIKSNEM